MKQPLRRHLDQVAKALEDRPFYKWSDMRTLDHQDTVGMCRAGRWARREDTVGKYLGTIWTGGKWTHLHGLMDVEGHRQDGIQKGGGLLWVDEGWVSKLDELLTKNH